MQKEMTFVEISALFNALEAVSKCKFTASPKFRYAVARNRDFLTPLIKELQDKSKLPEDDLIQAYEKQRQELIKNMTQGTGQLKKEEIGDFNLKLEAIQDNHKEAVEMIQLHSDDVAKFVNTTRSVKLYSVSFDRLPEDIDDQAAINGIYPILVDKTDKSAE
jgi:hypothetical protein